MKRWIGIASLALLAVIMAILISPSRYNRTVFAQSGSHRITLSWTASTDTVAGYNVYRSGTAGGPYSKQNSSTLTSTGYVDTTVAAGGTYFYVARSVGTTGAESANSNEASATVPINPPTALGATSQ